MSHERNFKQYCVLLFFVQSLVVSPVFNMALPTVVCGCVMEYTGFLKVRLQADILNSSDLIRRV